MIRNRKGWLAGFLSMTLLLSSCGGSGGSSSAAADEDDNTIYIGVDKDSEGPESGKKANKGKKGEVGTADVLSLVRPSFLGELVSNTDPNLVPSVSTYEISDLMQLSNADRYEYLLESPQYADKLKENLFVVEDGYYNEFFEIYETNRYAQQASFVTVDSMMHTYHLYFAYLMRRTEQNSLSGALQSLSKMMMDASVEQYNTLTDEEWKEAARRNIAFFAIAAKLQDDGTEVPSEAADIVNEEISRITAASGIATCSITGGDIDYTQFIPRGYYEKNEVLQRYFRAMMWYGQIGFYEKDDSLNRSAGLMTAALTGDRQSLWESIYTVTSFFAGASDDLSYYDYKPALEAAFGSSEDVQSIAAGDFAAFKAITDSMEAPVINSIPMGEISEDTDVKEENKGFRFMGQRFSIDEAIFEALTNDAGRNSSGEQRMLPDTLDVAAALGSEKAYEILLTTGVTDYPNYESNLNAMKEELQGSDDLWNASLYSSWLNTLRPTLEEKGDGYPSFMTTDAWKTKALESFAGSYTELKHDTVLYAKQMMAEMGGGDMDTYDDRGYVEPETEVWSRFINLSQKTKDGLDSMGYLEDADRDNLGRLTEMAQQLLTISEKELRNEVLSDEEYEFIRSYGGNLEHFWTETLKEESANGYLSTKEYPAALVTDIASNSNGECLEVATGNPANIYVIAPVAGVPKLCTGSVFSFYQFVQPSSDRLTDTQWRQMMGIELSDSGSYNYDSAKEQPQWTSGYRVKR
ncbi:MAG: DUF3160 domain-containing protein [Eubacteriales bacterium]|nr:DUF3160 domain-containing protein [Eubacteriales bacterium]